MTTVSDSLTGSGLLAGTAVASSDASATSNWATATYPGMQRGPDGAFLDMFSHGDCYTTVALDSPLSQASIEVTAAINGGSPQDFGRVHLEIPGLGLSQMLELYGGEAGRFLYEMNFEAGSWKKYKDGELVSSGSGIGGGPYEASSVRIRVEIYSNVAVNYLKDLVVTIGAAATPLFWTAFQGASEVA